MSIPVLLISSQDAAINIERVPEELAAGIQMIGVCERCAFIIKVNWDAFEMLKLALLRERVGIAHARKLVALETRLL